MISTPNLPENDEQTIRRETAKKLRGSFLQAVTELNGQTCSILTYEQSRLSANFSGWKKEGTEVLVRNLKTPTGAIMPAALLRSSDIIAVEFNSNILLP